TALAVRVARETYEKSRASRTTQQNKKGSQLAPLVTCEWRFRLNLPWLLTSGLLVVVMLAGGVGGPGLPGVPGGGRGCVRALLRRHSQWLARSSGLTRFKAKPR